MGCVILFALPFAGGGVVAMGAGIKELMAGKVKEGVALILFGTVFSLVGFGLMVGGFIGAKKEKEKNQRKAEHPNEPWRWREDWAAGRADSLGSAGTIGIWILAILWNLISSPVAAVLVPQELKKGNHAVLLALIFPLIGLGLLAGAIYSTLQRKKFGRPVFKLLTNPWAIGGQAGGMIEIPKKVKAPNGYKLKLECIERLVTGSGKNRNTKETPLWQENATVTQDLLQHDPNRTGVPVQFMIPATAKEASWDTCNPSIHWRLTVEADVPGVDLKETFELPVFRTTESPEAAGEMPTSGPRWDKPIEDYTPPAGTRIRVEGLLTGGSAVEFPAARNLGAVFVLAMISGILTAVIAVMVVKKALIIFHIVFGLFDAMLIMGCLSMLTHSSRVEADADGVKLIKKGLLGKKEERYLASEIVDVTTKVGMQAGTTNYYDLQMHLQSGRTIGLGNSVPDAEHAAWLAAVIKQAVGLKKSS